MHKILPAGKYKMNKFSVPGLLKVIASKLTIFEILLVNFREKKEK